MDNKGINHYIEAAKRSAEWHSNYIKKMKESYDCILCITRGGLIPAGIVAEKILGKTLQKLTGKGITSSV